MRASQGSWHQARNSDEVLGCGDQVTVRLEPRAAAAASFTQAADGLHPAERLLDPVVTENQECCDIEALRSFNGTRVAERPVDGR